MPTSPGCGKATSPNQSPCALDTMAGSSDASRTSTRYRIQLDRPIRFDRVRPANAGWSALRSSCCHITSAWASFLRLVTRLLENERVYKRVCHWRTVVEVCPKSTHAD